MRLIVLMAFLTLCQYSYATNYYVAANGNDNNSGTSTSSPWKTINKVNSFNFKSGDQILFNRGDEFYGGIIVKQSGTSSAPITFGAYGSGAKPIITGFTRVTSWTSLGGNIWESSGTVSSLSTCNMVVINNKNTPMGRWPNTGWYTYESASGNTSITSSKINSSISWKGAEAVIRKNFWTTDRGLITSQSGSTINYKTADPINGNGVANNGFFIQNDIKTLDIQNEWYFNPSTKRINIYSTSKPNDVRITSIDNLFSIESGKNYISIDNLNFVGANSNAISVGGAVIITNCDIEYCGINGVTTLIGSRSSVFKIEGNTFTNCNNNSINNFQSGDNVVNIKNNTIRNTGMIIGGGQSALRCNIAIRIESNNINNEISFNRIDSCGYSGIVFKNGNIRNNYVTNFCYIMQDGGGIYCSDNPTQPIENNIISNANGDYSGIAVPYKLVYGVYMDRASSGVTVRNNSVSNIEGFGYYFNDADRLTFTGNTAFGVSEASFKASTRTKSFAKGNITDNIFCIPDFKESSAYFMAIRYATDFANLGTIDNNHYVLSNSSKVFRAELFSPSYSNKFYDYSVWNNTYKNDLHSTLKVVNITSVRFEMNPSNSSKTINLGASYKDVKGQIYNGSVTLAPYSSIVLFYEGVATIQPLISDAGPNQTITLPVNSATLNGNGTGGTGGISSYNWSKLSGPSGGTISDAGSATTKVNGLTQGTYQFVLRVRDNAGVSAYDTVQILVRPAGSGSGSLIVKAGNNLIITLPANVANLNGSVEGGTASSVIWTKVSGPSSGSIASPGSISTSVSGLTEGVYIFQLEVKDSEGQSYSDMVQVSVTSSGLLPALNPGYTVNGLEYAYYEGSGYTSVPDFSKSTAIKSGNVSNFDLSVANRSENFAIEFNGYIEVPTDGQYTFYTSSDDGSLLYVDGNLVVNNDGKHSVTEKSGVIGLKAGKHAITVGFFQAGSDKELNVSYAGPGISKRTIPSSSLYRVSPDGLLPAENPSNTVNGLKYAYYEGSSYAFVPDFSKSTAIKSGNVNNFDLSVANRDRDFAIEYSGYIDVPTDGQYTFYTSSDDGSLLYIDGNLVVNNDGKHSVTEKSGVIGLKAGKHALTVGFFQAGSDKVLNVSYAGPGISKRTIPSSSLYRVSPDGLLPAVNPSNTVNGLKYAYYEGSGYTLVPDFSKSTAIKSGNINNFDLSVANRDRDFAIEYSGYIEVPADGQYTFYTSSDDGSLLYIDGNLVVDNNGRHGATEKSGVIGLKVGKHHISVGFFQSGSDKVLNVSYAGTGISKRNIPSSVLFRLSDNSSPDLGRLTDSESSGSNLAAADQGETLITENLMSAGEFKLTAFPNPFINSVTINLSGDEGAYKLYLFDVMGRTVWIRNGNKGVGVYQQIVNTSTLQKGIYFLKVVQGNRSAVFKLEK